MTNNYHGSPSSSLLPSKHFNVNLFTKEVDVISLFNCNYLKELRVFVPLLVCPWCICPYIYGCVSGVVFMCVVCVCVFICVHV